MLKQKQQEKKPQQDLNLRLMCRDCRDVVPNIIEDFKAGDLICGGCGLVLGNRIIDTRSEWRTFANSDDGSGDPSRIGAAVDELLGTTGLESTVISGIDGMTGVSRELNRTHSKVTQDRTVQYLAEAFRSIQHMADAITLPRIVSDTAKQLFKRVDEEKILKGKSVEAIKAACLYIACREHSSSRTFKEICNLTKVSKKEIGRCFKLMQPHLVDPNGSTGTHGSLDSYVYRFCSQLDLGQDIIRGGLRMVQKVQDRGPLAGKSPITVVASCLYFVSLLSDSDVTAKEIADTAQCAEGTLRSAYRILLEEKEFYVEGLGMKYGVERLS